MTNHLGNVLSVVTDNHLPVYVGGVLDHYVAQVVQAQDYYAFGAAMEGRSFSISAYRFGFNGKENDPEFNGNYDFGARFLDVRLGRWLSTDPVTHSSQSPYTGFDNNPILLVDPSGMDSEPPTPSDDTHSGIAEGEHSIEAITIKAEPRLEVKNYHENKRASAYNKVQELKFKISQLEEIKDDVKELGGDMEARYKSILKRAKSDLKSAESDLLLQTEHYQKIETALNEYQFHDPKGYNEMDNLKDERGNPIDVYFFIDQSISATLENGGTRGLTYSEYGYDNSGNIVLLAIFDSENPILNAQRIGISSYSASSTVIAHEKGHLMYFIFNTKFYIDFVNNNPNYQRGGHGPGDPSGRAADRETQDFLDKKRNSTQNMPYDYKRK
jgi:RHS repeat-associated protein